MHALIADDDRVTTAILAKTLQQLNVETTVTHDGAAAWALLNERRPSLAIIDWMMPGLFGTELCRRIRIDPSLAHIYVILVTGRTSREDVVTGLQAGADDYVVKPFNRDELRARVHVGIRVATLQERLSERVAELQSARDELARLASTDTLTGLYSRGRWFELAAIELMRHHRYNHPVSLLMIDVDHFKKVNDTLGHEAGDDVLRKFARGLRARCRQPDIVGRVGGEEFAVLLPDTPLAAAIETARRITEECRTIVLPNIVGTMGCSCSIGVAEATPLDDTIEALLRKADAALYKAKRNGRDRVEMLTSTCA